ncbi:MAG TPA: biotin--[acetyl-CoA-carboxylase] ligase [Spirochaetia bacterium]
METRETTTSTMDDALSLARAGCPTGTAVVAGDQEKGRGRVPGRSWLSPPWESLLATLVIHLRDMPCPLGELPLRAGVAFARAVERAAGITVGIKWPNDLVVEGRKLAGVLCEAHGDIVLAAVGVNCLQAFFPPEIEPTACSLLQLTGRRIAPLSLLPVIRRSLEEELASTRWRAELDRRLWGRGMSVRVDLLGSGLFAEGVVRGVDESGMLLLEKEDGRIERIAQGEISAGR